VTVNAGTGATGRLPEALVVGGSKFVGPALVRQLQDAGYRVTVLNRGTRNDSLPDGVETIICDRKDHAALKQALALRAWDAVFDVVAYVPQDTIGLLEALDRSKLRHFVHVSTCSVYLPMDVWPLKEHFPRGTRGPGNDYGDNKYLIEEILFDAYRDEGFPVTMVRPGYIYGPRNSVYREAFYFDRLLAGRPLLVPGDGSAMTQFGYVDDLASLMVAVLGNDRAVGEAYNLPASMP
jgi:dTDP-glucose 4,6-dehydratase